MSGAGGPAGPAAMTVAEALALPELRRGLPDVVAGREHVDRPIRWVHAGEVPNLAELLTGGELLLTTGMGIGRRVGEQRDFVRRLAAKGVAALVIEVGGAFDVLPPALVEAAEHAGLPLVVLRREVPFVAVTEAIHTAIVNRHYGLLRRADEIHEGLVDRMLGGDGVAEVLSALADELGNPLYLHTAQPELLYHAAGPATRTAAMDAWQARTSIEGGCAQPVAVGPDDPPGGLLVLPVVRPLDPVTPAALQRTAGIVSLGLLRDRQEAELLARERGSLLVDLVEGRIEAKDGARHAEAIGFRPAGRLLLPFACTVAGGADIGASIWDLALADLQRTLRDGGLPALVGIASGRRGLLGLVGVDRPEQRAAAADRVAAAVRDGIARRIGPAAVTVAVGDAAAWPGAGPGLRAAVEAAAAARGLPAVPWHDARDLELDRLLWHGRDADWLRAFVERTLGPVIAHDRRRGQELVRTIEVLSAHGGARAQTARALEVNRQTLYARIARIEELLGVDLADGSAMLTLGVAVRARRQLVAPDDL